MVDNTFSFGGISSSRFQITCDTEQHFILPEKRKYTQEIIGFDGVADFGIEGYDVRIITLPIFFEGNYADLRANEDAIAAWLRDTGTPKQLIFGNKPDRYYLAKVYAALDFSNTNNRQIGTIQFECNPPWCYLLDGTLLTPEQTLWVNCNGANNQFYKEFEANGNLQFVNSGSPTKPKIKLIGSIYSGLVLRYGTSTLALGEDVINDGIIIDCENETITRMSTGENLYPIFVSHDFFTFAGGKISMEVSMPDIGSYPQSFTVFVEMNVTTGA